VAFVRYRLFLLSIKGSLFVLVRQIVLTHEDSQTFAHPAESFLITRMIDSSTMDLAAKNPNELTPPTGADRYRRIVDDSTEVIYRISPSGHFTFVNPTAARIVRKSIDDCIGVHFLSLIREDYRQTATRFYAEQVKNRTPLTYFEFPAVASDGSEVWIGQNVQIVLEYGQIVELQGLGRDITVRKQMEQQLLNSEQRYRLLFETNPHPMWVFDLATLKILTVNRAAVKSYGYSETEFLSMTVRDIEPEHVASSYSLLNRKHLKKDGSVIDSEITSLPIVYNGRPSTIVTATDVTARLRAEAEGRVILDVIQSVNVATKLDGLLQFIHESLKRILYAENCFVALHDSSTDLIHFEYWVDKVDPCPPPRPIGGGFTSYVLSTGQVLSLTRELKEELYTSGAVTKVGATSASWLGVPLRTPSRTIGILVVQHYETENAYSQQDIDFLTSIGGQIALAIERKQGEQALLEANQRAITDYDELLQRLATLAESFGTARDLSTICRALHNFAQVSAPCEAMLVSSYDATTREAEIVYSAVTESQPLVLNATHYRCLETGEVTIEQALNSTNETALVVPMLIKGVVVGAVEIRSTEIVGFKKASITAMKMAAGLAASAIENVRLLEVEREKEEQLRQAQKMEAIGMLAGGVAHDFNNLLTAITGYAEMSLRRLEPGDVVRRNILEIQRASARATSLTRQLLAFSRKQIMQVKVFDLNVVVSEMEKLLRRLIGEHIELKTILGPDLGYISADPGQIEQVLMNLVVNARDALLDCGEITIETANVYMDFGDHKGNPRRPYVMLSVTDTGVGMDEVTRKRIFDPFFTTKEIGKGTGLGLSTVYGVVDQSNGKIEVVSEVGKGSKFMIYLPRTEKRQGSHPELKNTTIPVGDETILIAEDEPLVRNMTRHILELSGYKVLEASSGPAAIEVCKAYSGPVHLLLTDVVMPHMSGPRLSEEITNIRPEIKTLFMSGYTDNAIVHQGVLKEGMPFLQKPFTPDALSQKVRRILDSVANPDSDRGSLPRCA
jgi:two-component system, cell cycle sensor histidine kinase and response regulator CckA